MTKGNLFIVSAPSGAGKTSLVKALAQSVSDIQTSISHTTRPARPGEENAKDYHFVDVETFFSMRDAGDFLEFAEVFGNHYGTSQAWLNQQLDKGIDIILEIDWQGAQQVKRLLPNAISIFILPPSKAALLERLRNRAQDSEEVIARRTQEAIIEMSHCFEADFIVINDQFDAALQDLKSIFSSQRLKIDVQRHKQQQLIKELLE